MYKKDGNALYGPACIKVCQFYYVFVYLIDVTVVIFLFNSNIEMSIELYLEILRLRRTLYGDYSL